MGSQRVGHNWATEPNWTEPFLLLPTFSNLRYQFLWKAFHYVQVHFRCPPLCSHDITVVLTPSYNYLSASHYLHFPLRYELPFNRNWLLNNIGSPWRTPYEHEGRNQICLQVKSCPQIPESGREARNRPSPHGLARNQSHEHSDRSWTSRSRTMRQ